jgi:hypothetical protein
MTTNLVVTGSFLMLVEEIDDQDESTHKNMGETDEEAQDTCPAFDNDLNHDVDDIEIKEDDHVLMVMVHLVDPYHFIHALSTVSGDTLNTTQTPTIYQE